LIKVLIADDHTILRAGLKHMLSEYPDIRVGGEAGNGLEVIAMVQAEPWDVLMLDMTMPGKSGIELIKQIRSLAPKLPILVLSMHKEDVFAVRALKSGASGYLCKDNAEDQLVAALRKIAAGGMYITAAAAEKLALDARHGDRADVPPHTRLSDREYQVFQALAGGASVSDIAHKLNLSVKTVSTHKTHVMEKLGCGSLADLVRYAIEHDLLAGGTN